MRYIVIFLAGAFGALLANRGIAVFNDAVRPVVPEYRTYDKAGICNDDVCLKFRSGHWIWNTVFYYVTHYTCPFSMAGNRCYRHFLPGKEY
mgnify:CR=1 FL=1